MSKESALESLGTIYKGMEIFGLTKGQFSIINLIEEILIQAGKADVIISTWTAADAEIKKAEEFLKNGLINTIKFIVDRSFPTRQKNYCDLLINTFGEKSIRMTRSHCKFIIIKNKQWNIVVRTSMNLNENKRIENFEISDDKGMVDYLETIIEELWTLPYKFKEKHFKDLGQEENLFFN